MELFRKTTTEKDVPKILDAADSTGFGTALNVSAYRHLALQIATDNSANLTVEFYISLSESEPTWGSAAALGNEYDLVVAYDLSDTAFTATNSFAVTGTDDVKNYRINLDNARWFNCKVSARSAGDVTASAMGSNNA